MTYTLNHTLQAKFFLEITALLLVILIPLSVHAGVLGTFLSNFSENTEEAVVIAQVVSAIDDPMLSTTVNPEPVGAQGGGDIYAEEGALLSTGPFAADIDEVERKAGGEISIYTVREGDTLSHIADMFGVSINTINWANDIEGSIQPGETLLILPISGVQHTVEEGETLSDIVEKYEGDVDEVLEYNQLASADSVSEGDVVVIPGGEVKKIVTRTSVAPAKTSGSVSGGGGLSHPLPGGTRTQGIHGYNAVDIGAGAGSPIRAAASGEVIVSKHGGWNGGYGTYLVIRHSNGIQTLYAHNSSNAVYKGDWVAQGQVVGYVGSTGRSTGDHLHFEVRGGSNPF